MADKGVLRTFEQVDRRADLNHQAIVHDHNLIGEGHRLGLVVGHVDHGRGNSVVQLFEL